MRAIDLYAGIGGWALGLRLAGIDVVCGYEHDEHAAFTYETNLRIPVIRTDIRNLAANQLPESIDFVVGSPPCTHFSYANRGGSGNIAEGLQDIEAFLRIVDALNPTYWLMENVPRVSQILRDAYCGHTNLRAYSHLLTDARISIIDISHLGLPQRRKRCVAGNIDISDLVRKIPTEATSLETALLSDAYETITDPNFNFHLPTHEVTDHTPEPALSGEEVRINRELKTRHPVYNSMPFPDRVDRPSRTITATCTRVSRESIIIESPDDCGKFRRLNLRERATLQGFPISYRLYAPSYDAKVHLIGNAIPPILPYYAAASVLQPNLQEIPPLSRTGYVHPTPECASPVTLPRVPTGHYRNDRRFRFSIPSLHFKSGMRFDMENAPRVTPTTWQIRFCYGTSRDIRSVPLDQELLIASLIHSRQHGIELGVLRSLNYLTRLDARYRVESLQSRWTHRDLSAPHPFNLLDDIDDITSRLIGSLNHLLSDHDGITAFVLDACDSAASRAPRVGESKLRRYAIPVFAGMVIGSWLNTYLFAGRSIPSGNTTLTSSGIPDTLSAATS